MDVMVDVERVMQVDKLLRERDIVYNVTCIDNTLGNTNRSRSPIPVVQRPRSPLKKAMDWKDYYPLHMIYNFMDYLEIQFPSTCTVSVIGKSVEGRDIKMLKISNSDASNTAVWLDGAIHSREWISTAVVTYIADHFARNLNDMPDNITNKDWYFVPVVNPDGYNYTHILDRMWRKNRARVGSNICGVDLNRNFSHYYGRGGPECSSTDPNHLNFRGPSAFSEPETSAIKDLILYSGTPFKIFLTFHSYSEVISFPWCFTNEPCKDYVTLLEGGTSMAKAIYETNGRMYKVGNFKDLMYNACGTSIDWSYGVAHIPFSYLVELPSKKHRFLLPKEEILDICRETVNGIKALARFVDTTKESTHSVIKKNRHYYGRGGPECSSTDPNHLNFRGPSAFSEPETSAIKDLILYSGTPFKIFLTFHSYSEVISFPWCFTNEPCKDYVTLLEGGTSMAKAIYETNGRMYKVGNFKDLMYNACGTSIDWSYGVAHIPFSYLVELPSKKHRFLLPKEEILDICRETVNGIKALARFVDTTKESTHSVIKKNR